MNTLIFNPKYIICAVLGTLWALIEPTLPFLGVCIFALVIDCVTAIRCNRRIYATYREEIKRNPKAKCDGKIKSQHMSKIISDLLVVFSCVILAYHIDDTLLVHLGDWKLAPTIAAIYCLIQLWSCLENESTCNKATWARALQKILADKTERHLGIKLKELMEDKTNS